MRTDRVADDLAELSAHGPVDEARLRNELGIRLIELADHFDSLDHRASESGAGTALQHECSRLREIARSL